MLQRAASNAYSWWWASNIRTKQSKWLDTDLEVMEARTKNMLRIVEEDGDSFAKKAEIYFKKRPELVAFVEDTYKAYRALADKYDHISSELHKANHTLATAFPDQIQFDMDGDDEVPKAITAIDPSKARKVELPQMGLKNRKEHQTALKKSRLARAASRNTKDKAQDEIDKLQKGILALQTEKEFIRESYESGVARCWEIEKRITDMQEEVFFLQDEYSATVMIDDDEARSLMAVTALKSCEATVNKLEKKQKKSEEETEVESERIKSAKEKMGVGDQKMNVGDEAASSDEDSGSNGNEEEDVDLVESVGDLTSGTSVEELAEKINELVNKVIELDTAVKSQKARVTTLRAEAGLLDRHLKSYEDSDGLRDKLKKVEEDLQKAQNDAEEKMLQAQKEAEEKLLKAQEVELQKAWKEAEEEVQKAQKEAEEKLQQAQEEAEEKLRQAQELEQQKARKEVGEELLKAQREAEEKLQQAQKEIAEELLKAQREAEEKLQQAQKEAEEKLKRAQEVEQQLHDKISILDSKLAVVQHSVNVDAVRAVEQPQQATANQIDLSAKPDQKSSGDESGWFFSGLLSKITRNSDESEKPERDADKQEPEKTVSDNVQNQEAETMASQEPDKPRVHKFLDRSAASSQLEVDLTTMKSKPDTVADQSKQSLQAEYAAAMTSYEATKKRLSEIEKEHAKHNNELMTQIRELKSANAMKDQEIQTLLKTLRAIRSQPNQNAEDESPDVNSDSNPSSESNNSRQVKLREPETCDNPRSMARAKRFMSFDVSDRNFFASKDIKPAAAAAAAPGDARHILSPIEEKFRRDIDTILEENLEFWLRFSTSFQRIQSFQATFDELQSDFKKIRKKKGSELRKSGELSKAGELKKAVEVKKTVEIKPIEPGPEIVPIDRRLRELKTELHVWLEQNTLLQGELESKFVSLNSIQEDISGTLEACMEASLEANVARFAPYQAAKFQGELLNIQLENNKVEEELKNGLELVSSLLAEVEKMLARINAKLKLPPPGRSAEDQAKVEKAEKTKNQVPLKSFLFNAARPKKKQSLLGYRPIAPQKIVPAPPKP